MLYAIRDKTKNQFLAVSCDTHTSGDYGYDEGTVTNEYAHLELYLQEDITVLFVSTKEICDDIIKYGKSTYHDIRLSEKIEIANLEVVGISIKKKEKE